MSREDIKDQQKDRTNQAQERDLSMSPDLDLSQTEANHQLAQLGSPFAHIPTPSDLTDLWDEADRFFDSLGDPNEFIEPEGNPTYQLNDQDLDYFQNASQTPSESLIDSSPRTEQTSEIPKPKVKFFDQDISNKKIETLDKIANHNEDSSKPQNKVIESKTQEVVLPINPNEANQKNQTKSKQVEYRSERPEGHASIKNTEKKENRPSLNERFIRRHEEVTNQTRLIVIAGGKGGVGRSLLCANLAFALSHLSSSEVGVVDLDPIHGSLHTYLGLEPQIELPGRALRGGITPSSERVPNTKVILTRVTRPLYEPLHEAGRSKTLETAIALKHKWLIVDAGIYSDPFTLDLFVNADQSIIMYTPDPNGLEAGHLFLQRALYRQLVNRGDEASTLARSLLNADHEGLLTGPTALARSLRHIHPQACKQLESSIKNFRPRIIVNQCRTQTDRTTADEISSVLKRKWRIQPYVLGTISYHHIALQSLVDRRPLAQAFPSAPIYLDIEKIARQVVKDTSTARAPTFSSLSASSSTSDH